MVYMLSSTDEAARLEALYRYEILDTGPEQSFEAISSLAMRLFNVPVAGIGLIDRERIWFKSKRGFENSQLERSAILEGKNDGLSEGTVFSIADTTLDPRTTSNQALCQELKWRFYASLSLASPEGYQLGILFIADYQPREIGETERKGLVELAGLVLELLEARYTSRRFAALRSVQAISYATPKLDPEEFRLALARQIVESRRLTRLYEAEKQLRAHQQRFIKIFQATPLPMVITRLSDGTYLEVNDSFTQLTGYTPVELQSHTTLELLWENPQDRKTLIELISREGYVRNVEIKIRIKNGEHRYVLLAADIIELEGESCILGAYLDVTRRKLTEEQLHQTRQWLHTIIRNAPLFAFAFDRNGKLTLLEGKGLEILGVRPAKPVGSSVFELFPQLPEVATFFRRLLSGERVTQMLDFGSHFFEAYGLPLFDEENNHSGVVGVAVDITERKLAEEQLRLAQEQFRQSQKMEAIGQLAGGVAHDFNNLLTAILGYSDLILAQLEEDNSLRGEIVEIQKAANRAAALTHQLLAFSRKQILQPKLLNLNTVVTDMDKLLRRVIGEDVELIVEMEPQLGLVKADPSQLEQVIMNLAVNARDAMPQGGKLIIETSNTELSETLTNWQIKPPPGRYVQLAVSDTGTGMDLATQLRIFEPFFTTKELGRGTGLGLSTVYGIVSQSGGYIWVYSQLEQGTTFKVYLPLAQPEGAPEVQPQKVSEVAKPLPGSAKTIMLVEDEESVRTLSRIILEKEGYTIIEAKHGREALLLCEQYPGKIDLLLTDVVMPYVGGPELAEQISLLRPGIKVVYLSGYTDKAITQAGLLTEGVAFLEKPFTPQTLLRRLRQILE